MWLGGDSKKVKNENHQLLGKTLLNLKVKNQQMIWWDSSEIKIEKLGFLKQKLSSNFGDKFSKQKLCQNSKRDVM